MSISLWAKKVTIPVIREGKHFTREAVHGAKTVMIPTEHFIQQISKRVLTRDVYAATAYLPAKRFKPEQYPFEEVLNPFFEKTLHQFKQHLDNSGLAQKRFPKNNTLFHHFTEGNTGQKGLAKMGVSQWHKDGRGTPGVSVVGFLYGPKKGIPLKSANLEISPVNPDLMEYLPHHPTPPVLALPRRHQDDTAMAIVNNTKLFHRGTRFDFKNNPLAFRKHSRIFIGE
jgi:hypothetical protein